jgi:ferric-dicitrate binding protein FerR (iron transport regulator)
MTASTFASDAGHEGPITEYQPGVCNIGPAEIARRRRAGHVGLVATVVVLAALILIDAPPAMRLLATLPAAAAASGYLQARLKFCAGFGSRGIFNFGSLGASTNVVDDEARALDRRRSRQISAWALAIGVVVGVVAALVPV